MVSPDFVFSSVESWPDVGAARLTHAMSQSVRDPKPRATKNSQRLYNLEEQERLYRDLGVSAMTGKDKIPALSQEENPEEEQSHVDSGEEHPPEHSDDAEHSPASKKSRRRSKESQILSDSGSEHEEESVKKTKRKRKIKAIDGDPSPKQPKIKKMKLQNGGTQKKGKKSPAGQKNKAKKGLVNVSRPAIKLPEDLLVSPEDSSVIAAHMNAYTKWLMDNQMLVSQQSINQFTQSDDTQMRGFQQPGVPDKPGTSASRPTIPSMSGGNLPLQTPIVHKDLHDLSTDESSNVDWSETEGKAPSRHQEQGESLAQPIQHQSPLQGSQQGGLLFNACEAEKNVPKDDDSLVGPDVSEQMSLMIKNFFARSKKSAKIDELLQEFVRPKNMPFLKIPFIEEEVYLDLAMGAKSFDKNCRHLQGYIHSAITALTLSLQQLILTEKLHPVISEAGVRVKKAIQLLAFSTKEINDRRKDALKSSVNPEYLPLLKHAKPPSDDWLLGGELGDSIKKCEDSKKLSEKIMKNKKPQQPQAQGQQNQNGNVPSSNQFQDKYRYKNRGRKDNRPYYKNHQQNQANYQYQGNQGNYPGYYQQPNNQAYVQPQQSQVLWQQYQQQLQNAQQVQAAQNQVHNRQNLGFQQQQWKDPQPQNQGYNSYNQKKRN